MRCAKLLNTPFLLHSLCFYLPSVLFVLSLFLLFRVTSLGSFPGNTRPLLCLVSMIAACNLLQSQGSWLFVQEGNVMILYYDMITVMCGDNVMWWWGVRWFTVAMFGTTLSCTRPRPENSPLCLSWSLCSPTVILFVLARLARRYRWAFSGSFTQLHLDPKLDLCLMISSNTATFTSFFVLSTIIIDATTSFSAFAVANPSSLFCPASLHFSPIISSSQMMPCVFASISFAVSLSLLRPQQASVVLSIITWQPEFLNASTTFEPSPSPQPKLSRKDLPCGLAELTLRLV